MQVANPNNVKIYNLSAGKSVPDWLTDRKKRALQKKDVELRRRIELIQDFDMPIASTGVKISKDGNYVVTTGIYKPRARCYELHNLSMKFERCFDNEVVQFDLLSDDYSKIVFLQYDRWVEIHSQQGRYYRTRIPKFGRDLSYNRTNCDLYTVGAGSEVFRLNLEQGRFLNSFVTKASELNCCSLNSINNLFICGSVEGKVEAWDPRVRAAVGVLDCAKCALTSNPEIQGIPSITALKFRDGLQMAVGTATGQVLLYDLRSREPLLIKDHNYNLPIKGIAFLHSADLVYSMDEKIVKMWERETGKAFTSIEPGVGALNDLCVVPESGLLFMANENKKILSYYLPAVGPAPKWCAFLDSLTEELEESKQDYIYDDYKFITGRELDELGLGHLVGSNLLRAYMHGYFMDVRLYHKAKSIAEPFAYNDYRKSKIKEMLASQRENRVKLIENLPKVNKRLALKLMKGEIIDEGEVPKTSYNKEVEVENGNGAEVSTSLLQDNRFKAIFQNPDFEVDEHSEEFRLLNPVLSTLNMRKHSDKRAKQKKDKKPVAKQTPECTEQDDVMDDLIDDSARESSGRVPSAHSDNDESSSDDDQVLAIEMKKQYKLLKDERKVQKKAEDLKAALTPQFYELKPGKSFRGVNMASSGVAEVEDRGKKASLEERLKRLANHSVGELGEGSVGNKQMSFNVRGAEDSSREREERLATRMHREERKKVRRPTKHLQKKGGSRFRKKF